MNKRENITAGKSVLNFAYFSIMWRAVAIQKKKKNQHKKN